MGPVRAGSFRTFEPVRSQPIETGPQQQNTNPGAGQFFVISDDDINYIRGMSQARQAKPQVPAGFNYYRILSIGKSTANQSFSAGLTSFEQAAVERGGG